ncbi:MAG: hypothetical protein E7108_03305 [Bacteroidales bacterium]|jgi:hypothetical protein|nr:hypothetical protein [Bacteroidales bacterium]
MTLLQKKTTIILSSFALIVLIIVLILNCSELNTITFSKQKNNYKEKVDSLIQVIEKYKLEHGNYPFSLWDINYYSQKGHKILDIYYTSIEEDTSYIIAFFDDSGRMWSYDSKRDMWKEEK